MFSHFFLIFFLVFDAGLVLDPSSKELKQGKLTARLENAKLERFEHLDTNFQYLSVDDISKQVKIP